MKQITSLLLLGFTISIIVTLVVFGISKVDPSNTEKRRLETELVNILESLKNQDLSNIEVQTLEVRKEIIQEKLNRYE